MKKILSVILVFLMVLGMLSGCQTQQGSGSADETTLQGPTQSPEEQEILKVLTIGNSHSIDAMQMLYEIFQKEAPEQKVVFGVLYYSGCNITQHADYITNNKPEYIYYKNVDGYWTELASATAEYALSEEVWDVVVLQQMNQRVCNEADYVKEDFLTVINYVLDKQTVAPKLAFHVTWTNPDDYALYLNDDAPFSHPGDKKYWRDMHEDWFGNDKEKFDQSIMYNAIVEKVQKYLVDTTDFLGKNYFEFLIPSATAVEYAQDVLGCTQEEVYRDYTHMNDYGRLMVGYLWYAKLMNLTSISQVNISAIPQHLHHTKSQYPAFPDFVITEDMKADIISAVNWALENPYKITQ